MPRRTIGRKPQSLIKRWDEKNMIRAIIVYRENKMGLRRCVKEFGVPQTTLQRFAKSDLSPEECVGLKAGRKPVLPSDMEQQLVDYLVEMDNRFYGLTRLDVKKMAYQLAQQNGIKHPFTSNAAGRAWFDLFIRRHKYKITIHKPMGTSFSRANGFNKEAIGKFFDILQAEYDKQKFTADRVFNVDETGLTVVQSKIPHVVGLKGKRQVGAITSAERGSLVTVICCMSAGGSFVPPMMIFPRKNWTDALMKGAPPGAIGKCHPSGWIQTEIFTEWFEHFLSKTHPTAESPVLLILDGHNSHARNLDVIERARVNHVTIVSIPPHSSHKTQPLDKTFMGTLKTYYSEYVRQWLRHSSRPLGPYDVAELFGKAYLQCQTASIAAKGFSETGIFPCDRTVFTEADFLPSSSITTVEQHHALPSTSSDNATHTNNTSEDPALPGTTTDHLSLPSTSSDNATLANNASEDLAIPGTSTDHFSLPSTSSGSPGVSPRDIMPIPPLKKKISNRGRKPSSSAVFTSSPYKKQLEESLSSKKAPAGKKKTTKDPPKQKKNNKIVKRLKLNESDDEFNESVTSGESILEMPLGVEKPCQEDAQCMFCGNSFSKDIRGELWIQCQLCEEWSHSECAGVEKDTYICDFCK